MRWEDSKNGGKRIIRQIRESKNSACTIRRYGSGNPTCYKKKSSPFLMKRGALIRLYRCWGKDERTIKIKAGFKPASYRYLMFIELKMRY